MFARRAFWLSVTYKAFGFASRQRPSPLQALLPARRLNSHSPAGPSAEIRNRIIEEARLLQKVDKSIPWYRLAAKHHLSIGTLQSICNLAEVDATLRQQRSALVTSTAERHFDSILGRCNWEAVASELDTPLVECLDLFDASNSTIQPRSLIETYGGWSKTDVEKLKLFMETNYADGSNVDWKLAGIYMNVRSFECQRVGQGTFSDTISEVGYRRICELRESTLSWKDIHQYFLQYPSEKSLMNRYHGRRRGLEVFATEGLIARLTDEERDRMKDLIEQHMESTTILELVDIIKRELPARLKSDIYIFSRQYVHELRAGRMNMNQMIQMRELVAEYGDDWDRIGKALGVPPSRARRNWLEHSGDVGNNSALSIDEARQLQQLIDSGVKPEEAARLLRIRLYRAYQDKSPVAKSLASRRRDAALSGSPWAAADDKTLLKIIHGTTVSGAIRWEQASMVLARSISAYKQRFSAINRKRKRKQALDDRVNSVTSEVQRHIKSNGAVDWSQVSQATGLGMRECLELSQHDVGKASWHYDPDSFSYSMVDRMTSFIEEYYPAPVPVNSRAVSNFMWVAMGDCIRIHNVFQGKFTWTDAEYEQAEALRAQGLTFKEVARRLSPMLSGQNVLAALKRYAWSKKVPTPYTSPMLEEISGLIDQYAGKYPVDEILSKISERIGKYVYKAHYYTTAFRLAAHPHYQTKLHNIDFNDVANRIVTGQITTKLAAKELDLPQCILALRIKHLSFKLLS